jgi:hypothetical protein
VIARHGCMCTSKAKILVVSKVIVHGTMAVAASTSLTLSMLSLMPCKEAEAGVQVV